MVRTKSFHKYKNPFSGPDISAKPSYDGSGRLVKRKLLLSEHTKEPKTFQCAHCDKSFKRRDNIYRHLKQDHPGEDVSPYRPNRPVLPPVKDVSEVTCKECNKHCGTRYGLKRHMIKHSDEKNHVCTECGKLYKGALQLKTHMKFHRGEYDYHCDQCDAKYVSSSALYNHKIQKHSGGFQLTCEHCGQTFTNQTGYRTHLTKHTGEKPYLCRHEGCDKR